MEPEHLNCKCTPHDILQPVPEGYRKLDKREALIFDISEERIARFYLPHPKEDIRFALKKALLRNFQVCGIRRKMSKEVVRRSLSDLGLQAILYGACVVMTSKGIMIQFPRK